MTRQFLTLVTALALATSITAAQAPALKIVVIEGENAVNIIQQKTAVKALVEVRDRNNLPVQGASVTFAVTGQGGAAVTGSPTVTVATNAAGRASLGGITPSSSGGLQISVSASYQGVSAAAVTISQTVVATAAAAAGIGAAAATAATTGAAAGGGGLSTAAIVGIVGGIGAIGGGAAVLGGGSASDDQSSNQTPTGTSPTGTTPSNPTLPTCVFTVSPTVLTVPISGGTFGVTVTMTPSTCAAPDWPVTNVPAFVTVDRMGGTGSGGVTVTVSPFTPTETFPTRTGAIGIAGTVVNIHQPRPIG
jgi:hypothetical protein